MPSVCLMYPSHPDPIHNSQAPEGLCLKSTCLSDLTPNLELPLGGDSGPPFFPVVFGTSLGPHKPQASASCCSEKSKDLPPRKQEREI